MSILYKIIKTQHYTVRSSKVCLTIDLCQITYAFSQFFCFLCKSNNIQSFGTIIFILGVQDVLEVSSTVDICKVRGQLNLIIDVSNGYAVHSVAFGIIPGRIHNFARCISEVVTDILCNLYRFFTIEIVEGAIAVFIGNRTIFEETETK